MKKLPQFLICMFLGFSMGCNESALHTQDQSKMHALDLEVMDIPASAINHFNNFKSLINFESDTTSWKEVEKKAKKESKPILFYGWALWCNPCNYENQRVLREDASLAQYLNDNFINTRYLMEIRMGEHVSEGWDVLDKFKVTTTAYPIFLFFDSKGKLVYQYVGAPDADGLLAMAQAASQLTNKDKIK